MPYSASDWTAASKYTDDTTAKAAQATANATANYFSHDAAGAHVGSVSGNPDSGKNLLMATGKIAFRDGTAEMGTIGVSTESGRTLMDITCGDSYDGIMLDGGAYVMNKQHVSDTTYGAYGSYMTCSMHETAAPRASLVAHRGDGTTSHPFDVEAELDVGVVGGKSYIDVSADRFIYNGYPATSQVLWTNPNLSQVFAGQTFALPYNSYQLYGIVCTLGYGSTVTVPMSVVKPGGTCDCTTMSGNSGWNSGSLFLATRLFTIASDGLSVTATDSSWFSVDYGYWRSDLYPNKHIYPLYVIGLG